MKKRLDKKFWPWMISHLFEFFWYYVLALSALYALHFLQGQLPQKIRLLTESFSMKSSDTMSPWIFLYLAIGILFFRTLSRLLFFYPARVQQKFLRMELLDLFERVPYSRYAHLPQGQIFQVVFDDVNNIRALVGFGLLQIGNLIIASWVLIPLFSKTDAYLWPAFIPLFSSVLLFSMMTFFNQKFFKQMMQKKGDVQQFLIESFEAKQTIKNYHREENFIKEFSRISGEEMKIFFKSSLLFAFTSPYIKLGLGLSLIWASLLIRSQGGGASDLVFFSGFLYLFLEPVMFISWVSVVLSQGLAGWRRVKDLRTTLNQVSNEEKHDLNFSQTSDTCQLTLKFWNKLMPFSFSVGKWTALIGETGVGKSYILSMMATGLNLQGLKISMVQQSPYLFNDTVEGNIFLGDECKDQKKELALELLRVFQLDSLDKTTEDVLSLDVGENGKRLSGGQIKRVALIRSLLSDSDIIIWDDPFSSVDIILEKKIINFIQHSKRWKHSTFLISSHRLTTLRFCHDLIYLSKDQGIFEQGSVDELLKEKNVAEFFKEQMVTLSVDPR